MNSRRQLPAGNPLANALVIVVGALAIGASIVLGVMAFIALSSVVLIAAAVVGIRVWWINRRLRRHYAETSKDGSGESGDASVIEGEYRVISTGKDTKSTD